jgi:hypothetical protein
METTESTLVKSRPELWEMVDSPEQLLAWSEALLGPEVEVEITAREPEELIGWTAALEEEAAEIEIYLDESGWGTKVVLGIEGMDSDKAGKWSETLFEDLAEPSKRPFSNG